MGVKYNIKNYVGLKKNKLEVVYKTNQTRKNNTSKLYVVKCYCYNYFLCEGYKIKSGKVKSCGCHKQNGRCLKREYDNALTWTGIIIGDLEFIEQTDVQTSWYAYKWKVLCHKCNNYFLCIPSRIHNGHVKSCGCYRKMAIDQYGEWFKKTTSEGRRIYTKEYVDWRIAVLERDNYTCRCCGYSSKRLLVAHHLNSWHYCINERFDIDNGAILCAECHDSFHSKYGRCYNTKKDFYDFLNEQQEVLTNGI